MISLGFLLKANSNEAEAALKKMEGAVSASASAIEGDFSKASSGILSKLTSLTPGFAMLAGGVTAVGGAMIGLASKAAEAGDKMYLASKRTGVSVETLGGLKLAAKEAGLSFDTVEMSMERMTRNLSPFATSGSEGAKAIHSLGIETTGTNGKMRPMGDILGDIADRFSHMKDGTEKTSVAMAIFGRSGAQLIPILDQGRAALHNLSLEEIKNSGITTEAAQHDHEFEESMIQLKDRLSGVTQHLGQAMIPAVISFVSFVSKATFEAQDWSEGIQILDDHISIFTDKILHLHTAQAIAEDDMKKQLAAQQRVAYEYKHLGDSTGIYDKDLKTLQSDENKETESIGRKTVATKRDTRAVKEHVHEIRQQIEATRELTRKRDQAIEAYEKQQSKPSAQEAPLEGGLGSKKLSSAMSGYGNMDLTSMLGKQTVAVTKARAGWLQYTQAMTQGMQVTGGMSDAMGAMYNKVAQIAQAHQKTNQLQNQSNQAMQTGTRNTKALAVAQGASLAEGTAMFIKNKKAQAIINAIAQTAEGIGDLAVFNYVGATLHFASAAMWGMIAGTAAGGGGQGGGGGRGNANQGYKQAGGSGSHQGVVGGGGMLSRSGGGGGNYHQSVVNIYGGQITDTNNLQNMVTMLNQGGSTGTVRMNVAGTSATIPTPAY